MPPVPATNVSEEYQTGYWMPLQTIHRVSDLAAGCLSLGANSFLIFLILTKTTRELKVYSRILVQNCIVDLVYTIITMITQAQIDFDKGIILMMMAGPFRMQPNPITFHLINLYIIALFSCVMFLPIPFIYRYFAVVRNHVLTRLQFAGVLLIAFAISICYTCLHAWAFWPRGDLSQFNYIIDHDFWKYDHGRLPVFVVSDIKEGRIIILVTFTMIMGSLSYTTIILFNVLIYRTLMSMKETMSNKTREIQRQLGNVLKYQALVPLLICVLPLTLVFILCAVGVRTAGKGIILTLLVTWIPVMNPLSTIIFIRQYRRCFTTTWIFRALCPTRANMDHARSSSIAGVSIVQRITHLTRSRVGVLQSSSDRTENYLSDETRPAFD